MYLSRFVKTFTLSLTMFLLALIVFAPVKNSSALDCTSGTTSASEICNTDTTDVNVSITGAWTVSVSSAGTLGLNLTPTSSGVLSTATDNVNVYTNTPNGYQLYLNSTSGSTDIYNDSVLDENGNLASNLPAGTNTNHFVATSGTKSSPATLTNNTWGYTLTNLGDNPSQSTLNSTTFSKVELTSSSADSLISSGSKTTGAGDNLPVTYGFMADTKLTPGTYSTQVTYTAIAEVPSYSLSSISPNSFSFSATDQQVTLVTSTPSTELGLGDITVRIYNTAGTSSVNLTNCTETIIDVSGTNYRGATCTYPGGLPGSVDKYNVSLTSSWHNATYVLPNSFTIYKTLQDFTNQDCANLTQSTSATDHRVSLEDSRDGKVYNVSKLADGNCWMVQNLALEPASDNLVLTPTDSNVTTTRVISPTAIITTSESVPNTPQIYTSSQNITDQYGSKYGNLYNWNAATATVGDDSTGVVNESICPKGWRLPDNDGPYSYSNLAVSYGLGNGSNIDDGGSEYVTKMQQAPIYLPAAGYYANGANRQGFSANYYTRTTSPSNSGLAYYLNFAIDDDRFHPHASMAKSYGFSIRCIFENSGTKYMQDFTTAQCNTLDNDASTTLIDRRDGKSYRVTHLRDGNCWMTQNLAYNGGILTPNDSNVTTTRNITGSIITNGTPYQDAPQIYIGNQNTTDSYGSKYGNLYNWNAATAGVGNVSSTSTVYESICPKGWRLPDISGDYSYVKLLSAYNLPTTNVVDSDAVARAQQAPLFFPFAGTYKEISTGVYGAANQGINTHQVYRTVFNNNTTTVYNFLITQPAYTATFWPSHADYKLIGFSARCILGN